MPYKDQKDQRDYAKAHYRKNKGIYKQRSNAYKKENRKKLRAFIKDYLESHPCIDCGETDWIVLEFDHVRGVKKFNIADGVRKSMGIETIKSEIKKCDVRCANCHRRKTYSEIQNRKPAKNKKNHNKQGILFDDI